MQIWSTTLQPNRPIEDTILASIFAHRVGPGSRLGEAELAALFGVSRTLVREAMMRLQARLIVEVRPRRGWFVREPSADEARQVFQARRVVEAGLMRAIGPAPAPERLAAIVEHLEQERAALAAGDGPTLICLMGDFHIRLAAHFGNPVLADILRDLTARTILISMLYQSEEHAEESHRGHCLIFEAVRAGDREEAASLAVRHLDEVEAGLRLDLTRDPLCDLRRSLDLPLAAPGSSPATTPSTRAVRRRAAVRNPTIPNRENQR
ncbi:GntR family transcriptional regulator [Aureimonas sp. AU12]|uniref:GntR family transcriptional regulator n=1 Tax=Aureimonas sp. AU12 TaxID=1638161 RepID=UPI000780ABCE|nr:GntR family transcriptional regulator [Aureimonas sp. AU12]